MLLRESAVQTYSHLRLSCSEGRNYVGHWIFSWSKKALFLIELSLVTMAKDEMRSKRSRYVSKASKMCKKNSSSSSSGRHWCLYVRRIVWHFAIYGYWLSCWVCRPIHIDSVFGSFFDIRHLPVSRKRCAFNLSNVSSHTDSETQTLRHASLQSLSFSPVCLTAVYITQICHCLYVLNHYYPQPRNSPAYKTTTWHFYSFVHIKQMIYNMLII